ncbi:hypothetical protein [Bradyrhizobium sp. DASA03120]|uniref:hypothetical protein n=1 Tax=Bradyrhizobium sp. SMVTL-02 TaxID=3395917 RepID=UPI003F70F168
MTDSIGLIDAAEYLRSFGAEAERLGLDAIKVHSGTSGDPFLLQSNRCWLLELVVNELVANAAARCVGKEGRISIELTHEAGLLHCAVSDNGSKGTGVGAGLDVARQLAKGISGRIGHWFDDKATSLVLTAPLTERECQANRSRQGG